jgi:short-subunit dehydrogenase
VDLEISMNVHSQRTAIVTGASSGIGRASAEALARAGFKVFGTSRRVTGDGPSNVSMQICDVTDDAAVNSLVATVLAQSGRIDVLVNNAGIGLIGGAEESSILQAQRLFDVNVFGVARVVNAVLPVMRSQKMGRIINMSSILGLIPSPFNAFYASTKHAVEGYSESLDHEVRNFGIRVVLVEPGVTRTSFEDNLTRVDRPMSVYDAARKSSEALMREWVEAGDSPDVVAATVVKAATAIKPKLRYSAGKQSSQVRSLRRYFPEVVVDKILRKQLGLDRV